MQYQWFVQVQRMCVRGLYNEFVDFAYSKALADKHVYNSNS